jgi:heme A synthase
MKFPLFLHVLSAIVLVGSLVLAAVSVAGDNPRLAFRALLLAAIPSWIAMRLSAQWTFSEQGWDEVDPEPAWIGIGFITSETTLLLIIAATVCAWRAGRRERPGGLRTATLVLTGVVLVAYVVAIWAMTTKPT